MASACRWTGAKDGSWCSRRVRDLRRSARDCAPADRMLEIDGQPTKSWTMEEARNALRGPLGSTAFKVVIERGGGTIPIVLERCEIHVR